MTTKGKTGAKPEKEQLEKVFNKSNEVKTHDDLKLIIERAKKAQNYQKNFVSNA